MLVSLDIQNYALISTLSLDFETGLSVVTGETGAGKSILIEALGLTLGERADPSVIGTRRADCTVAACHQVTDNPRAQAWLEAQALGDTETCTLRRVLYRDGRPSRAFINDRPVAVQTLRELGNTLIDLHGQHEHQSLTRRASQLDLLDAVGDLGDDSRAVKARFSAWQTAQSDLARSEEQAMENEETRRMNLERLVSLRSLDPKPGEFESLALAQRRIDHLTKIRQGLTAIREALVSADGTSCESLLRGAGREARTLTALDPALEPLASSIDEALIRLEGCSDALDRYEADQELDPDTIAEMIQRFDAYQTLAYKYRLRPESLHEAYTALAGSAESLEGGEESLARLRREAAECESRFYDAARKLSSGRTVTAGRLAEAVNALLPDFGMAGAALGIQLQPEAASAHGLESVTFEFTSHPDQEPWPLGKVASGGELSRIALAIQLSSAGAQWIPTLIFDEIDVGIGGRVAELVGQKLRALGNRRQVLCITHLPQVACQGHHHFKVLKTALDGMPETQVETLKDLAQEAELARMLAGSVVTQTARRHAREMLEQAGNRERIERKHSE